MLCPNCDNVINATGCQACGWKTGDPFPAHRLVVGSSHPLKEGVGIYPSRVGEPRVIPIVHKDVLAPDEIILPELKQDQIIVPEPEPVAVVKDPTADSPIPDPVSNTVQ